MNPTNPDARASSVAAVVLGLLLASAPGWAQTAPASAPPAASVETSAWAEGPFLTGDWGGLRTRLADRGLQPYALYSVEGFATVAGGIETGLDWTSQLEFGLDADLQKLVDLTGATVHASFLWIEGTDPSEKRVGNLNRISNLSAPPAARVYQYWYRQAIGAVATKLGQVVVTDDFMVSSNAALYLNDGFGSYPTLTANTNAPSYPLGGPGAAILWQMTAQVAVQSGVYVGDAGPNSSANDGFGWRTDHGGLIIAEASYSPTSGGLPGTYKAGGYYHTGGFDDLRVGSAGQVQGNYSLYALADQALLAGPDASPIVAIFAGVGLSPQQDRNPVYGYGQGGVNVTGIFAGRPTDVLGLGASYTRLGDDFVRAHRVAGTPVTHQEVIVELTYQAPITRFLTLQPDLQLVFDANQSGRDAVVIGVRLQARF